mgnify:CR=1 FL=1|tara:strand:- start:839 stop:1501 length:663 start_codon:yes stop_codon:yes gene_type:complete
MKVVRVYGALKKRLGNQGSFEFDVRTPAEAIKALCANFEGLEKWLIDSEQDGIGYRVLLGKEEINEEKIQYLGYPWSAQDIFSITPVLTGSGRGGRSFLFGAALIGASFLFPGAGMFGTYGLGGAAAAGTTGAAVVGSAFMTGIGTALSGIGASLVLGGIAEIISPTPTMGDLTEANKLENFSFSGIINTAQQGLPVPIAYGRCFCGSAVISSGLDVEQR